jgi:hypothetical protein
MASRLVQYGVPARPGIGGVAGSVPVAITTPRRARKTRTPPTVSTVTSPGAVIRARPRAKWPPLPVNRSTAALSFQESVASSRIRRATGAQSGVTLEVPAMPGVRRASASRPTARIIIFDGTQPR